MPMHMTATLGDEGGNILLSCSLGMKERKISRKEHTRTVPSILPYASSGSTPSAFMAADAVLEHREEGERGAEDGEHAGAEHIGGVPGILNWRQLTMVQMPARMRDAAMAYCWSSTSVKATLNFMTTNGGTMRPAVRRRTVLSEVRFWLCVKRAREDRFVPAPAPTNDF